MYDSGEKFGSSYNEVDHRKRIENYSQDTPTYSRLFTICDKSLSEDQLRNAFSTFGTIEDVRIPRDHNTGERKGVAYIKFSKTSEAATALEQLNGKTIGLNSNRPIKVKVATSRSDIQTDDHDDEKYKRLFIYVDKTASEDDIAEKFDNFGKVVAVAVQRNRDTRESKGFAYVTFSKFSEAANAFENCDKKYRAIFALPKNYGNRRPETNFESNVNSLAATSSNIMSSVVSMMDVPARGFTRVNFMGTPHLCQRQIEKLFDIIPGMENCQYFYDIALNCCKGTIDYANPVAAAYAVEKINGFEYPPGSPIFVRPDRSQFFSRETTRIPQVPEAFNKLKRAISNRTENGTPDLAKLAEAIAEASKIIKMASDPDADVPDSDDLSYCSVTLPPRQPLADIDSPAAKRCFLVCKPQPPPQTVLRDVFCRFGSLINVYTLPNKTVGFARYATAEAADAAIAKLHGAEICGVRIKVLEAEDETQPKKRNWRD